MIEGKIIRLGTYENECDAALAFDRHVSVMRPS